MTGFSERAEVNDRTLLEEIHKGIAKIADDLSDGPKPLPFPPMGSDIEKCPTCKRVMNEAV